MPWYRTDKQTPDNIQEVTSERVQFILRHAYIDVPLAMHAAMESGQPLQNEFAYYEWKEEKTEA